MDGVDNWAHAYGDEYELLQQQASSIYHYRELQYAFNIFATRQPPMFATHTQNWNDYIIVSSYWMDCEGEPLPHAACEERR
jgi:hypothetical protein